MICDNCNAPKEIKNTFGCHGDRLHNAWEDFKSELSEGCIAVSIAEFPCRRADLIAHPTEKGGD